MSIIPQKTVASVMSTFYKTIDQLDKVALQNETKVDTLTVAKINLEDNITAAEDEVKRARKISDSLRKIVG